MTELESKAFFRLAQQLAVNYYHVSVSTANPEYFNEKDENLFAEQKEIISTIFRNHEGLESMARLKSTYRYCRNILIIGAGASKNAFEKLLLTDQIVDELFYEIGFYNYVFGREIKRNEIESLKLMTIKDILDSSVYNIKQVEKFFQYIQITLSREIDDQKSLGQFINDTKSKFEDCLKILQYISKDDDIGQGIQKILGGYLRYIPNEFYEIVAHMFKHRFVDVIINLNFDELLDNSLEDEMGETEYIKIYNEATSLKFIDAFIDNRLIKPIYIKPHGTVSDVRSMKYTIEHYLGLSNEIKKCLSAIFEGEISSKALENKNNVKKINVISVGYSFGDIDIISLLAKKIKKDKLNKLGSTIFYIFETSKGVNSPSNKLMNSLLAKDILKDDNFSIKSISSEKNIKNDSNINKLFVKLYYQVKCLFNVPFQPSGIIRHQLLSRVFDQSLIDRSFGGYVSKDSAGSLSLIEDFIKKRTNFNLIYEYVRFNGNIPKNIILGDRIGKYYSELKRINIMLENGTGLPRIYSPLREVYFKNRELSEDQYTVCDKLFYNHSFDIHNRDFEFEILIKQFGGALRLLNSGLGTINIEYYELKDASKRPLLTIDFMELSCQEINLAEIFKKIVYTSSYEINTKYSDFRLNNFIPFKDSHLIPTNLTLTWKFFDFAVNKTNYNHIDIITLSGNALTNLTKYSSSGKNHLKELCERGVSMNVLLAIPIKKSKNVDSSNNFKNNSKYFSDAGFKTAHQHDGTSSGEGVVNFFEIDEEIKHHQMILFSTIDRIKQTKITKYAIYFFKPPNKNRINPIWFSIEQDSDRWNYNKLNLDILQSLFDKLIIKATPSILE